MGKRKRTIKWAGLKNSFLISALRVLSEFYRRYTPVSEATKWSNLRSVGTSGFSKATLFVPVLGFAVVYNVQLNEVFDLQSRESQCWPSISSHLLSIRTDILYLGLVIFGTAIGLFQIFCPNFIKLSSSGGDYAAKCLEKSSNFDTMNAAISISELFKSRARFAIGLRYRVKGINHRRDFESVLLGNRFSLLPGHVLNRKLYVCSLIYNESLRLNDNIFSEEAKILVRKNLNAAPRNKISNVGSTFQDYLNIGKIIRQQSVAHGLINLGGPFSQDLYSLRYEMYDREKPGFRLLIMAMYGIGACITLFPTLLTVLYVIGRTCILQ